MKTLRSIAAGLVVFSLPALAFAGGVTFKNKDRKSVELTLKRAGSSQTTGVPGGVTMEIPGAPMKISILPPAKSKAAPITIDAVDGDIVTWEKGKLTRVADESADPLPEATTPDAPAPDASASPK